MEQRVALITGGARGIGRAIGLALGEKGWRVALCYRKSVVEAKETAEEIALRGGQGMAIACDVSKVEEAQALVRQVMGAWGRVDALINCAGPYHRVSLLSESTEGWHEMFDNNLHPVFYLCKEVAPIMTGRSWGRIVNFGMATADQLTAQPNVTAHYIAKAGILVLTKSLARLLAPHGITVNAVSPGFIDSGSAPADELSKMCKSIPAGYIGSLSDAVSATLFLLSDEARYVNGTNIHLSGAWGI